MHKLSQIGFHNLIRFIGRYKQFFFHGICNAVIIIYANSCPSFMYSAVHVAIHDKIYAPCFVHIDNLYVVFSVILPAVHALIADKAKYLRQLTVRFVVTPKLSSLYKTDNAAFFIISKLYFFAANAKLNVIIVNF